MGKTRRLAASKSILIVRTSDGVPAGAFGATWHGHNRPHSEEQYGQFSYGGKSQGDASRCKTFHTAQ